jgi:hypothetical protein
MMRKITSTLTRRLLSGAALSLALAGPTAPAIAADMPEQPQVIAACPGPQEVVILYDEQGRPTVPGRTEYYYCVTGTVLRPGDIPPPPEYCCS